MNFAEQIKQVCLGRCLNPAEKLALRESLTRLANEDPFGSLMFWGKIYGAQNDYLIARSLNLKVEISKRFYFSIDEGKTFAMLPNIDAWVADKASKFHGQFTGDPSAALQEFVPGKAGDDDEGTEGQPADEGSDGGTATIRQLTELERLSWTVLNIDHHTHLIITGSYIRNAASDLILDPNFLGLGSSAHLQDLSNYQHLRAPRDQDNLFLMSRRLESFSIKSGLDSIATDLPKKVWTIAFSDCSGTSVILQNHLWPGFSARVSIGSKQIEQAGYFGHGQRNQDLIFAI